MFKVVSHSWQPYASEATGQPDVDSPLPSERLAL